MVSLWLHVPQSSQFSYLLSKGSVTPKLGEDPLASMLNWFKCHGTA